MEEAIATVSELSGKAIRDVPNVSIHKYGENSSLFFLSQEPISNRRSLNNFPMELVQLSFIKRLDLSFNFLSVLPNEIGTMVNLRHIVLSSNTFSTFPEALCNLSKLQTLVLSKNSISELPPQICRMSELRELDLFMNKLREVHFKEPLMQLSSISLHANRIKELSSTLATLPMLTRLDISNNAISTLEPLGPAKKLQRLECSGCALLSLALLTQPDLPLNQSLTVLVVSRNRELTSIDDLRTPQLTELRAVSCNIERVTSNLEHCPKLRILDLDGNPIRERLRLNCAKLEMIGLCNTKVILFPDLNNGQLLELALADSRIAQLPRTVSPTLSLLRRLYLQGNEIVEFNSDFFHALHHLQELSLRFNGLQKIDDFRFKNTLVSLDLAGNQLCELHPDVFSDCSALTSLDLSANHLSDLPDSLWQCKNLVHLNVFSNCLRFVSVRIGNLAKLSALYAGNNMLTDLPKELSGLKSLQLLHVAGNFIVAFDEEHKFESLEKLYAGRNLLQEFPNSFSQALKLNTLDLSANKITNVLVKRPFCNLQELILSHNGMTAIQLKLGGPQTFPKLVCLDISSNPINVVPDIGGIATLEIVNLLFCNISVLSRKQLEDFSKVDLIYMQGNPIERGRQLRVSFVERKTDLLMTDLFKHKNKIEMVHRLKNSSTMVDEENDADLAGNGLLVSWSEVKGARSTQEDAIAVRTSGEGPEAMHLFAVFDGHRGSDVAQLCAVHFPATLRVHLSDPNQTVASALKATFGDVSKTIAKERLSDGATVAVALIQQETIALAHLGDARVVLFSLAPASRLLTSEEEESATSSSTISVSPSNYRHMTRKLVQTKNNERVLVTATLDHTAKNRVERRRVEQELGGFVSEAGHVMGDCAVTRALGDLAFSPFVTNEPSVVTLPRTGTELFLVVACDGFWDACSNERALHIISDHLTQSGDPSTCSLHLRDYALSMGSTDNISVLCLVFPAGLKRQ